jgi:hypothetical protein
MNRKALIRLLIAIPGLSMMLISIFAFQLGLDNNLSWGVGRLRMLILGLCAFLFGASYWFGPILVRGCRGIKNGLDRIPRIQAVNQVVQQLKVGIQNFIQKFTRSALIDGLRNTKFYSWFSGRQVDIWLILASCFLIWLYLWVITTGKINKWPSGWNYYWMLSQAFQKGQTYLLDEPNPELMKLENPYDHSQRKDIEYLWDSTFYNGKYYLYWGPAPAVLGVIVSSITSKPVTDAGLVFSFVLGTALFSVLLLRDIYREYHYPAWVFWGGVLASAVNIPLIWLLAHPTFYEVSISGGQFFLMAGFFALFRAFRSPLPHRGYIAFASSAFGLAGATRINLLPSVVFLAVIIFLRIYIVHQKKIIMSIPAFLASFLPLALIACSLCWYNYDRFGSIFEFGYRYQLTVHIADNKDITSTKNIIPNIYTYFFSLPSMSREFPFLTVPWATGKILPSFIHLPKHYRYLEPVAGILSVVPLIGLTGLLILRLFWLFINGDISLPGINEGAHDGLFSWFGFSMFGYGAIQTFLLLIFIFSSIRYLLDISPALIVLSTVFVGYYVQFVEKKPYLLKMVSYAWILASLLTVISGFFIGFTGEGDNFLNQNPRLYYQLFNWFSG